MFLEMRAVVTQLGSATSNPCTLPLLVLSNGLEQCLALKNASTPQALSAPDFPPRPGLLHQWFSNCHEHKSPGSTSRGDDSVRCWSRCSLGHILRNPRTMVWVLALWWLLHLVNKLIYTKMLVANNVLICLPQGAFAV